MINMTSVNGKVAYDVCEFICDYESDVANLPKDKTVGSSALVLETLNIYMINGEGQWVKLSFGG